MDRAPLFPVGPVWILVEWIAPDSSRKPPIKIDHEVVAAEDELEGIWWSAIFQGSPDKIMYDGHSLFDLENLEKLKANR